MNALCRLEAGGPEDHDALLGTLLASLGSKRGTRHAEAQSHRLEPPPASSPRRYRRRRARRAAILRAQTRNSSSAARRATSPGSRRSSAVLREEVQLQDRLRGHALAREPREDAEEQGQAVSLRRPDGRSGDDPRRQGGPAGAADAGQGSNLAALKPGTDPHGRHVGELSAALARHRLQHQGACQDGPDVLGRAVRSEVQGPRHPAVAAEHRRPGEPVHGRHLETGKPMAEAQNDTDAGFKKLVDAEAQPAHDLHADAAGLQSARAGRGLDDRERALPSRSSARRRARRSTSPRRRKASSPCRRASRW